MDLAILGWNDGFSKSFESMRLRDAVPGRVILEYGKFYLVAHEGGEVLAEPKGKLKYRAAARSELPVVGDWVAVRIDSFQKATVLAVLERYNKISRKVASHHTAEQIIASNVDLAFIVTSLDSDFSPRRLERYILLIRDNLILPVIVLNKADLSGNPCSYVETVGEVAPGIAVHLISAVMKDSTRVLLRHVPAGTTAVLLGSSGVGKSTIINSLLGEDRLKTGNVRDTDCKGRHTTSNRELVLLPNAGMLIDNPGMREIQLWGEGEFMDGEFEDVSKLAQDCRFRDCRHENEPGCAVREAIAAGNLDDSRLDAFFRLSREAETLRLRQAEIKRKKAGGRTRLVRDW